MKKNICIILVAMLLLNAFSTITFANDAQNFDKNIDVLEQFNEQILPLNMEETEDEFELEQKLYCDATIEDDFIADEILVVLSKEQSALKQEYTVSDFPGISLENVYVLYDYYPEDQNNMVLSLVLSEEGKQNVLNAIDILEQDEKIISAEPNFEIDTQTENASTYNVFM